MSPAPPPLLVVVRALAPEALTLRGAEKVVAQRAAARAARSEAARLVGAEGLELRQAPDGRPLPTDGWHWSVSHGGALAAAVLAREPVGVDLEPIAPRRADVVARVLADEERAHLPSDATFTAAWTAKEAVLKATQLGLSGLRRCRVVGGFTPVAANNEPFGEPFPRGLLVALDGAEWRVLQREHAAHVLAVTSATVRRALLVAR